MLRWFLEGLAAYGQAHYGRGPIEGLGGFRAKKADAKTDKPIANPEPAPNSKSGAPRKS